MEQSCILQLSPQWGSTPDTPSPLPILKASPLTSSPFTCWTGQGQRQIHNFLTLHFRADKLETSLGVRVAWRASPPEHVLKEKRAAGT